MKSFAEWVRESGLERYAAVFAENDIDFSNAHTLSEADLRELGLTLGHRRNFLAALATVEASIPARPADPAAAAPTPAPAVDMRPSTDAARQSEAGERRQLSVLFCDMVGFTELASRVDPEILRDIIRSYEDTCAASITRYEGYVFQRQGDGIVAFFGYPLAHEGEADRAIRAALEIVASLSKLDVSEVGHLQVRIGIATGLVVVSSTEKGAVGETMNLASRLQNVAQPGSILVSERVHRLAGGAFDYEDLGEQTLKGIARPTRAYRILRVSEAASRFDAATQEGLTPMVGREQEIALLLERWQLAQHGEGQVVLLSGEPGIGKSRILSALRERLEAMGADTLRLQCSPYYVNSAFWPSVDNFERALKFARDESAEAKLDKLEAFIVTHYGRPLRDVRFVASMLSIPCEERYGAISMTPQRHKEETLRTLVDLTEAAARRQRSVMLFEDVHWADPGTLEVLDLLIDRVRGIPLLIVLTHRPEFQSRWSEQAHVSALNLSKLTRAQSAAIVSTLAGGKALPSALLGQILAKTDGVPLFVEEFTKSILESGELKEIGDRYDYSGAAHTVTIPATIRDSLMARLDRFMPVKEIAQIGAAIGREFSYDLIAAVAPMSNAQLDDALARLTASGLAFRRGTPPDAVYTFKHALVRDAAYESLLKSRRAQLHGQIARAIERKFPDIVMRQPEIVAHHFTEAALAESAISYWLKAGNLALSRSANTAVGHLNQGLKQIHNIDDPTLRNKWELLLQTSLGNSLQAAKGWSNDSVKHAYTRALQLCKESGLEEHTLPVVFGLWTWNFVRPSLGEAQALAEDLLATAENVDDSVYKVLAHEALGFSLFARGKFFAAHAELERSISMCEDSAAAEYLDLSAQDPRVHVRLYDGMALWFLGYPDQALRICAEARLYADASQHPFSEAMARTISLRVHQFRGEVAVIAGQANAAIALCEEYEFVHYLAWALIMRGWARAQQGEFEEGIAEIQQGLEKVRATGALLYESYALALLADACIKNERYGQALEFLDQAQSRLDEENSDRFYTAEIYRLVGVTHLRLHKDLDHAERCLCRGLEVAREQKAKSLELKLCLSMYDVCELRQNSDEYRSHLREIYGTFSEGFDTTDLVDAKARLNKLA